MADMKTTVAWVLRSGKRIAISVLGLTLVVGGIVLLVLPGPGLLVIIAGLAVLATEYAWARSVLDETKKRAGRAADKVRRRKKRTPPA